MPEPGAAFGKIEHFFVLMLENRSFDHMFGAVQKSRYDPLTGREQCSTDPEDPHGTLVKVRADASDVTQPDPPHEFQDVRYQLTGRRAPRVYANDAITMSGFAASAIAGPLQGESARKKRRLGALRGNGSYALSCQGPRSVGVLRKLAEEFALCTNWYSSMPGPTWPNRFFVHAATSCGLDNSPGWFGKVRMVRLGSIGFDFPQGTLFSSIGAHGWRVYHDDALPQVLAIQGMASERVRSRRLGPLNPLSRFRKIERLESDLAAAAPMPAYIFIEPNHDLSGEGREGNSQHPEGSVRAGEKLIADVYRWIRSSSLWEKSALLILYDEHGGFFDHKAPPAAEPPDNDVRHRSKARFAANFAFDRLGVRVPAVIISPWIARGVHDPIRYDHSSVCRTLGERFGFDPLTARAGEMSSFSHLFTHDQPRSDAPPDVDKWLSPEPREPVQHDAQAEAAEAADSEQGDEAADSEQGDDLSLGNVAGVLRIAVLVDHELRTQAAPPFLRFVRTAGTQLAPSLMPVLVPQVDNREQALRYIADVSARLEEQQVGAIG